MRWPRVPVSRIVPSMLGGAVLPLMLAASPATAQPPIALQPIATGLAVPVAVTHAGDRSGRLFITLQDGRILVRDTTGVRSTPFLDIRPKVTFPGGSGESGLFSVAFHPNYALNGFFYVNYTDVAGSVVMARYHVSADPNVADPTSEAILLTIVHDQGDNHNGGQLQFGPDGYLYVSVGDGGGTPGDPENDSQSLGSLLGKILRIDVNAPVPYAIPPTNPFVGIPGLDEIWAYGLRNPWRFTFDRLTGDMFIGDVGQGYREEIDFQPAGSPGGVNYGWNIMEGTFCYPPPGAVCNQTGLTLPILELDTTAGNCSIIGGYRYRGTGIPGLAGTYLYGDFCAGSIFGATPDPVGVWTGTERLPPPGPGFLISTFGEDEAGELYVARYASGGGGAVYRIVPAGSTIYILTVRMIGGLSVQSGPPGIQCPPTCAAPFPAGAIVTLTATPTVDAWNGGCSGTGDCVVTMTQDVSVTASFPGAPPPLFRIVTGAGEGAGAHVRGFTAAGAPTEPNFLVYPVGFVGGVRVAVGDVDGDGIADVITAAGPTGGPHIRVFAGPAAATVIAEFLAYDAGFSAGLFVAAGDVDGDHRADIITGAGPGGGPHVKVTKRNADGSLTELRSFLAYAASFTGGITVAACDLDGDHRADIITGAGPGGGPHVQVFSGATGAVIRSFMAYDLGLRSGIYVACGDVDGDGVPDIVTGVGAGGGPHVQVFSGATGAILASFFAYDPAARGGMRVGAADLDGDGRAEILTAPGPGGGPHVKAFTRDPDGSIREVASFFAYDAAFTGGVFVAGAP